MPGRRAQAAVFVNKYIVDFTLGFCERIRIDYKVCMPKKPKVDRIETEKPAETKDENAWSEDQANRQYYYDDAHGYEEYVEDDDENEKDDE